MLHKPVVDGRCGETSIVEGTSACRRLRPTTGIRFEAAQDANEVLLVRIPLSESFLSKKLVEVPRQRGEYCVTGCHCVVHLVGKAQAKTFLLNIGHDCYVGPLSQRGETP